MEDDQTPYGMRPDDKGGMNRLRKFAEKDQRTFKQMMSDQPRMRPWEKFFCCCGCILIIPVPLAIIGALFL